MRARRHARDAANILYTTISPILSIYFLVRLWCISRHVVVNFRLIVTSRYHPEPV